MIESSNDKKRLISGKAIMGQQDKIRPLEELDAADYACIPAQLEETELWLPEQDWGDES